MIVTVGMVISMANTNTALKSQNPSFHDSSFLSLTCVTLFASTCFSTHSPPFFSTFYWRMIMFWDEKELYLQQQYLLSLEDIILSMSFSSAFALPPSIFRFFASSSTLPHFNWTDSLSSFFNLLSCNICSSAHHMQLTALLGLFSHHSFFALTLCLWLLYLSVSTFFSGER